MFRLILDVESENGQDVKKTVDNSNNKEEVKETETAEIKEDEAHLKENVGQEKSVNSAIDTQSVETQTPQDATEHQNQQDGTETQETLTPETLTRDAETLTKTQTGETLSEENKEQIDLAQKTDSELLEEEKRKENVLSGHSSIESDAPDAPGESSSVDINPENESEKELVLQRNSEANSDEMKIDIKAVSYTHLTLPTIYSV